MYNKEINKSVINKLFDFKRFYIIMNKTSDIDFKLNIPLPVAVYSPFCAHGTWKYRKFFIEHLFDPMLPISSQIHLLVQRYGWSKLKRSY